MLHPIKKLTVILFTLIALSSYATNYTSISGNFSGIFNPGYDSHSHNINVTNATTLKITIEIEVSACYTPDGYSSLVAVLSASSYWEMMEINTGSPDYESYKNNILTFYTPNNCDVEFYFDTDWCYDGYYNVEYEALSTESMLSHWPNWLFDANDNNWYLGRKVNTYGEINKSSAPIVVHKDKKLGVGMEPVNQFDVAGNSRFSVNTNDGTYLKVGNFKSSYDVLSLESWGNVQVVLDNNNNDDDKKAFYIRKDASNGAVLMSVWENGNVGVNTVAPATTFHVNGTTKLEGDVFNTGTIKTTEVVIEVEDATWPDYVFEKEYNLLSLKEVEAHISEKGHLPFIPSAQKVSEEGVGVGEMNKLLLQKVEELTLYIIEQDKRIQDLESKVK